MANVLVATRLYKEDVKAVINIEAIFRDWCTLDLKDALLKEIGKGNTVRILRGKSLNKKPHILEFTRGQKLIDIHHYAVIYDKYLVPGFELQEEFDWDTFEQPQK